MNILSLIMQYLGPVIVNKLASSLGVNPTIAQKIVAVALPAILGGLIGRVGKPGGAQALADSVSKVDPGMLGKLGDLIGSPQQAKVAEQGADMLGGLLGGGSLGALSSAVGKFGGVSETVSKGMIGMLAPAVLGTIGLQQKASGLDAAGLGKMLLSQKDNIQAALPADFAKLLGGSGLLDGLAAAAPAAPPKPSAPAMPAPAPARASSGYGLWSFVVLAAALALAAWYFLGSGTPRMVALPNPPQVMAGQVDVGGGLGNALSSLQTSLAGIKTADDATASLPKLRTSLGDIDKLSGLAGSLPAESKRSLASYVAAALPLLLPVVNNMLANSSYGPILKPVLDQVVAKLQALSKA